MIRPPDMGLDLSTPEWDALAGGTAETSWIADRYRKLSNAAAMAEDIERVFYLLSERKALFEATTESLLCDPFAAFWYVSLAGFSQKTLENASEVPAKFGMSQSTSSLVSGFAHFVKRRGESSDQPAQMPTRLRKNLEPFLAWINSELRATLSPVHQTPTRALMRVSLLLGGRIIGQGQNEGGNDGVTLVKELIYRQRPEGQLVEARFDPKDEWHTTPDPDQIVSAVAIRFGGRLECNFTPGGNRPDIIISLDEKIIAVGEIKARKDLSNLWESWMPQVASHMKTWKQQPQFSDAVRLFFGTVITQEMIEGRSALGTPREGLRDLVQEGFLTGVYNLSHMMRTDLQESAGLDDFCRALFATIR